MGRANLEVDTGAVRQSVHTLDARVADLVRALARVAALDPPPLGRFPHGTDATAWHGQLTADTLGRLAELRDSLTALRDGNATIAARYESLERATGVDLARHAG
ncbi:MAG: hypothetical protein WCA46_19805 [Actinocatenispora sp.]